MTTGWRITASNGEVFKSHMSAAEAYGVDNSLTFESSEFDMAGDHIKDVTDEVRGFYERHINKAC